MNAAFLPVTFDRSSLRSVLAVAFVSLVLRSSDTFAADFQKGDRVTITRSEKLFFLDREFRTAAAGEVFTVAGYRPELKKVFLLSKDEKGREIAVSVIETAVASAPIKPAQIMSDARTAVRVRNFTEALRIVQQAQTSAPNSAELNQFATEIKRLKDADAAFKAAKTQAAQIAGEVARLRRNANVADRPNLLNANDTSNQDRAERIRAQADAMEAKAKQSTEIAEFHLNEALATFDRSNIPATREGIPGIAEAGAPPSPNLTSPIAELNQKPAPDSDMEVEKAVRAARLEALQPILNDPPIEPPMLASQESVQVYNDAIETLNNKLAGKARRLWFGKEAGKMIYANEEGRIYLFDPAVLNSALKFRTTSEVVGAAFNRRSVERHQIIVECRNGRKDINFYDLDRDGTGDSSGLVFYARDSVDQERLGKALRTVIEMLGARPDEFSADR